MGDRRWRRATGEVDRGRPPAGAFEVGVGDDRDALRPRRGVDGEPFRGVKGSKWKTRGVPESLG